MIAATSPVAYGVTVGVAALICAAACAAGRRWPGPWRRWVARAIGLLLLVDLVSYIAVQTADGTWSFKTSLPLALCDVGVLIAGVACFWNLPLFVELTYFWGLAGTIQAVAFPDLSSSFPSLVWFQYTAGHLGIVFAALFLVVGMKLRPRPNAVVRVFVITLAYTAFVGVVDWLSGANYMFLRQPPAEWTLLKVLGPWPWYVASAAGVAIVLFTLLDLPFWPARSSHRAGTITSRP
ncbi:MAG: TIGR02206 family membrane protein [Acidimicrobiales bacterium]